VRGLAATGEGPRPRCDRGDEPRRLERSRRGVRLTNLDKELYPADGFTKGAVIEYYRQVADAMLTHLAGRPLTMRRYPNGIDNPGFFQKKAAAYFPDWVRTVEVPQRGGRRPLRQAVCEDTATLVYLANLGCLEFHGTLSTVPDLEYPDRFVIDLDPPDGAEVSEVRMAARRARDVLLELGLTPYVLATGGRGFHVVAALDRSCDFAVVSHLAHDVGAYLAAQDPRRLTVERRKDRRGQRIYVDVTRNAYGQTAVTPYSLRARPGVPVAVPVAWAQLGRVKPDSFHPDRVRRRLARGIDPWADLGRHPACARAAHQRLSDLAGAQAGSR
jgi:bifunctional non-homologous end joining protein LigD